ncbi:hypothetical protein GCM10009640_04690 [Agrococcus citreus]|uniref:Uncharacterized protein n=1 Tax=Agrococcus citreus TaxID=84643 RepID=A0ABN1YQD4_9MICO
MSARTGITEQHAAELTNAEQDETFGDPGHGHSRAAWISVIVMIAAFAIGTLFFVLDMPALVWASAGLLVIGMVLWPILNRAGFGPQGH